MSENGEQSMGLKESASNKTAEQKLTNPGTTETQDPSLSSESNLTAVQRLTTPGPDIDTETQDTSLPSKDTVIDNLTAEEKSGRGSVFDSTFLSALTNPDNAESSLAKVWQDVENDFAEKNGVPSRANPYTSEKKSSQVGNLTEEVEK